jgi:hypothetical protein
MISEFPTGLGQGIQSTTIIYKAIEIPDRAEETYESYVKCFENIIAFWFTPNKKDATESDEGSEENKDSDEESAKKKPAAGKRKAELLSEKGITKDKLAETVVAYEQQGVNAISNTSTPTKFMF